MKYFELYGFVPNQALEATSQLDTRSRSSCKALKFIKNTYMPRTSHPIHVWAFEVTSLAYSPR